MIASNCRENGGPLIASDGLGQPLLSIIACFSGCNIVPNAHLRTDLHKNAVVWNAKHDMHKLRLRIKKGFVLWKLHCAQGIPCICFLDQELMLIAISFCVCKAR